MNITRFSAKAFGLSAASTVLALTLGFAVGGAAVAQTAASLDLVRRATDPNPTLNSYTASAQLSATLHAPIPIRKTFSGSVFYLKPNRKIEFQGVPGALSKFKDLTSATPSYDQASAKYTITPLTDDGSVSTYSLVPKATGGRVKSVTLTVSDRSALVKRAVWSYTDGGTLTFDQTYTTVGDFHLPARATIAARFPKYNVDGVLTITNYAPNAAVSPSVFATPSAAP
ncbi:MAG TPA: hypothetical protein VMF61_13155 [Candidatus Acidoferrales bacterium]|nr:hypothetical protein [Candidatus Acidoferrales bacterium]